ncbi:MAG: hypothetical protein MUE66_06650 [Acidimicrobiia bacterium]|nr:hypothetical protein [Acidimicrobiia bacterium]
MAALTDEDLAGAVAAGDHRALEAVYGRHGAAVFGMARRVLRSQALAEEVAQEVFVRFWRDPGMPTAERWICSGPRRPAGPGRKGNNPWHPRWPPAPNNRSGRQCAR